MLVADALLVAPAAAGLSGMLAPGGGVSSLGLAGVALAALFLALAAGLSPASAEADAEAVPLADAGGLDRRALLACAAVLGLIGGLSGAMAVAVWVELGGLMALGLGAVALAFLVLGAAAGLRARRRAR